MTVWKLSSRSCCCEIWRRIAYYKLVYRIKPAEYRRYGNTIRNTRVVLILLYLLFIFVLQQWVECFFFFNILDHCPPSSFGNDIKYKGGECDPSLVSRIFISQSIDRRDSIPRLMALTLLGVSSCVNESKEKFSEDNVASACTIKIIQFRSGQWHFEIYLSFAHSNGPILCQSSYDKWCLGSCLRLRGRRMPLCSRLSMAIVNKSCLFMFR